MAEELDVPVNTPKQAERLKAFELYVTAAADGKRRSFRSIAMELGGHETTITRWHHTDGWDTKVSRILDVSANTEETVSQHIKRLVRDGLTDGLRELGRLAVKAEKDQDRIQATKTLAEIASKIDAISTGAGGTDKSQARDLTFKDDLPDKEKTWPVETPALEPVSASSIPEGEKTRVASESSPVE